MQQHCLELYWIPELGNCGTPCCSKVSDADKTIKKTVFESCAPDSTAHALTSLQL